MTTQDKRAEKEPPPICSEVDEPFDEQGQQNEKKMSSWQVEALEKRVGILKQTQNIVLRDRAYLALKWILITLVSIFIVDTVLLNLHLQSSPMMNTLIEFLKIIGSSMVGYVFAEKNK